MVILKILLELIETAQLSVVLGRYLSWQLFGVCPFTIDVRGIPSDGVSPITAKSG